MAMTEDRTTGVVKWFNGDRGFATTADDFRDVFLHRSQWTEQTEPRKGQRVSFIEARDRRGPYAREIRILREEQ
jgi:cold shock CspA family protein